MPRLWVEWGRGFPARTVWEFRRLLELEEIDTLDFEVNETHVCL